MNIPEKEMIHCHEGVRPFDRTHKGIKGVISLNIRTGPIERKCRFKVKDMNSGFQLLLGRPWINATRAVASTLHQKLK